MESMLRRLLDERLDAKLNPLEKKMSVLTAKVSFLEEHGDYDPYANVVLSDPSDTELVPVDANGDVIPVPGRPATKHSRVT